MGNAIQTSDIPPLRRRERWAILIALIAVTLLSWGYLVNMVANMDCGMCRFGCGLTCEMTYMEIGQVKSWSLAYFNAMLVMWVIMMIGMMVPTAIPMTLIYAAIYRKANRHGTPIAPASMFIFGYIVAWSVFSLAATLAQWGLSEAALLSPMMVSRSPLLGSTLLIAAGAYQMTPFKTACLEHCRAPAHFISQHWRPGGWGALVMGMHHGAFCLGCCWVLMALLFLGGVMNLIWIAIITIFVLLEKVLPFGHRGGQIAGGAMILTGIAYGLYGLV